MLLEVDVRALGCVSELKDGAAAYDALIGEHDSLTGVSGGIKLLLRYDELLSHAINRPFAFVFIVDDHFPADACLVEACV